MVMHGKPHIKLDRQQAQNQRHFNQGRDDAVERIADERVHAAGATLDVARHAAGLALQVKAQAHGVQVAKNLQGNAACCAFGRLGKHQFTQFGEKRGAQPQGAVAQQQRRRYHQQGRGIAGLEGHGVHQAF